MIRDFENADRDKAVIWLSYYKSSCRMNDADKLKFIESIFDYLFFGVEPEFDEEKESNEILIAWDNVFPNLVKSRQCADRGSEGGKAGKGIPKPSMIGNKNASKQKLIKSQTKANQKPNKTNKDKDKDKEEEENNNPLSLSFINLKN